MSEPTKPNRQDPPDSRSGVGSFALVPFCES